MGIAPAVFSIVVLQSAQWGADWAWGLPLIVSTVILHVLGLGLIGQKAARAGHIFERRHPTTAFVAVVGATTLLATCLHALEASIWGAAYLVLGAVPNEKTAMLYSLNAITSYGHENLMLSNRWQLMGAMEALNGWLLFGLTTAFLFGTIEKVWVAAANQEGRT